MPPGAVCCVAADCNRFWPEGKPGAAPCQPLLPLISSTTLLQNPCRNQQYCRTYWESTRVHAPSLVLRTPCSGKTWSKEYIMHRTTSLSHFGMAICLGVWLCTQLTAPVAAQDRMRAKVGIHIRSGERNTLAKGTEMVKVGDFLRVCVIPEDDAYVYVVHNDGKAPTLLNTQDAHSKMQKGSAIALPMNEDFYKIDGTSDTESITVICSPTEIREVTTLFRTPN